MIEEVGTVLIRSLRVGVANLEVKEALSLQSSMSACFMTLSHPRLAIRVRLAKTFI